MNEKPKREDYEFVKDKLGQCCENCCFANGVYCDISKKKLQSEFDCQTIQGYFKLKTKNQ